MEDYSAFTQALKEVEARRSRLSEADADHLKYLEAWKDGYDGRDAAALEDLRTLKSDARDPTLRFRAQVAAVHVLSFSRRYEDAFRLLAEVLQQLPKISDRQAREEALLAAAQLYGDVGHYDLALGYAQALLDESSTVRARCEGATQKLRGLYETGRLDDDAQVIAVIEACRRAREGMYAGADRMVLARYYTDQRRYDDAIRILVAHYDDVERLYNPRFVAAYNALLAQIYYKAGRRNLAHELARRVTVGSVESFSSSLAEAYQVLYQLARDQGDYKAALDFHERYTEVDKAFLDEVSARALAFQRVEHESIGRQLQMETLHRQNSVLQLQKELTTNAAENSRLQVALLTVVLTFLGVLTALIAAWAYRTKRLQLHFMTLSRIDSLTGIYNRPYFIEQADSLLEHCRRAGQDVSMVLWDADYFKQVNDRYGHAAGDSVLRRMTHACKEKLRRMDVLGRFGGEEFAIMLPGCTVAEAAERAEILRAAVGRIPVLEAELAGPTVSASFGVTSSQVSGYQLGALLGHADAALYAAKRTGRNRVVIYDGTKGRDPDRGGRAAAPPGPTPPPFIQSAAHQAPRRGL
jgi:diguanylate cyclase (GGDEF)-like protein